MRRSKAGMRGRLWVPLALVVLLILALPVAAFTETAPEHELKELLGIDLDECEPMTNLASPWATRERLPFKLDEPRGAGIGEDVYMVGGIVGLQEEDDGSLLLEPSDELTRFRTAGERFEDLAPMPRRLNHIGVVAYRGEIYVVGGYGRILSGHTSKSFFRYVPATDRWTRLPDMPEPRAAMAVGVVGHRLIVAGGARDNTPLASTYAYDFESGSWSRLPDMGSRREHVGAAVLDGKLYVLGGRTPQSLAVDTAERFDAKSERWEELPRMPVRSGGLGAAGLNGRVFAVGGGNDAAGTVTGAVQEFDPRSGRWKLLAGMRTPRHGQEVASTDDTIWAIGGSPCPYYNASDYVESLHVEEGDDEN
ncbi:MAG TPA: kelch repeat-containing protein [Solirubrobacterales bacterium]|nr:kelch repeat-containing protein [Solirubrobacterales bacterium]